MRLIKAGNKYLNPDRLLGFEIETDGAECVLYARIDLISRIEIKRGTHEELVKLMDIIGAY